MQTLESDRQKVKSQLCYLNLHWENEGPRQWAPINMVLSPLLPWVIIRLDLGSGSNKIKPD
jgi:hypothetical protein